MDPWEVESREAVDEGEESEDAVGGLGVELDGEDDGRLLHAVVDELGFDGGEESGFERGIFRDEGGVES